MESSTSRRGEALGTVVALAALVVPALLLVRRGLGTGAVLGLPWGEQWGRLFVHGEVARWLTGLAPPGVADLANGVALWPTDPLMQLVGVPAGILFGEATGWALELGLLAWLAGVGGYAVARVAGASRVASVLIAMLLPLHPLWLRHGAEGVTEVLAIGAPALWFAAAAVWVRDARGIASVAGASLLLAATSPYFALYTALAAAVALPWTGRRGLVALGVLLAVGVVVALPLLVVEADGRLGAAWRGGYALSPEPLSRWVEGRWVAAGPPVGPATGAGAPFPLHRVVAGWPAGVAVSAALVVGLLHPRARWAAVAGGLVWLLGPASEAAARALGHPSASPLAWALHHLPFGDLLGNDVRLVAIPAVLATWSAAAASARLRGLALVIGALAWVAGLVESPPLALPASSAPVLEPAVVAAVRGPTVTFPSGDPPVWSRSGRPKEGLWLAVHHGGAQSFDYGRGGEPVDAPLQAWLARVSGVAIAEGLAHRAPANEAAALRPVVAAGYRDLLVIWRDIDPTRRDSLRAWALGALGAPLADGADATVWRLPTATRVP